MSASPIVRTYYVLAGLYTLAASLIWGVNTLFLLDAGLTLSEVFVANALFSAGMVVFEIPTGVVADTVGRRVSYLLSVVILAATTLLYVAASAAGAGVLVFALVSIAMGLGFTFFSGALEAWLVDALGTVGGADRLDGVFARAQQVTGASMLIGTPLGGLLGQIDLAAPFVVRAVLLAMLLAVAWRLMHDIGFVPRPLVVRRIGTELAAQTRIGVIEGWNRPGLRMLMLAGVVRGAFLGWAFYAAQPYFLDLLDSDRIWVAGVITALMSLSTIVGNQLVAPLTRRCGRRTTVLLWASLTGSVASIGVGLADSFPLAVGCFLVVTASTGVLMPVRQAYLHATTSSEHRATVISFDAMLGSMGGVGGQLGLGRLADVRSLSAAYVVGGATTVLALPFLLVARRIGGRADAIVPEPGLGQAACAGHGLPAITLTEARPRPLVEARSETS